MGRRSVRLGILRTGFGVLMIINLQGCLLTKVVTVPLRVGGAIISVVPVVGEIVDETLDTAADAIDLIPL
ncbi:MAG: hypothetical protein QF586_07615 [Arenicellales bacterium]|jgi:hypothetical protein|nr:hypothetical protein [Acidiferrobacteraceae bacterium]MDP6290073.1 hypothetical protein [Arenicellales bacterium]MBT58444.1 hypothetical protein [Acidiferrobacteraceae bacterium]MDP6435107.1 hypothetical protein [Arenicellales bacterium]MDP6672150.1 hypothetical protein [Arenicellales bacterium]|tara:strand:- start:811 stop:1020 length:210 start_codon:yes stop_codon:yes gene_type:complete